MIRSWASSVAGLRRVLIDDHLEVIGPLGPGHLRNVVEDFLTQFVVEGDFIETGKLMLELGALDHSFSHSYLF